MTLLQQVVDYWAIIAFLIAAIVQSIMAYSTVKRNNKEIERMRDNYGRRINQLEQDVAFLRGRSNGRGPAR